jgi:hypothetical protein
MPGMKTLQISPKIVTTALAPQQKRFNALIKQIEQERQNIVAWEVGIERYRENYVKTFLPLQVKLTAMRRDFMIALDELHDQKSWNKSERNTLKAFISGAVMELLCALGDDDELKRIFAKHGELDFDAQRRKMMLDNVGEVERATGVDLGNKEGLDEQDLFELFQSKMREQIEAEEAQKSAKKDGRWKSGAQLKREEETKLAGQSVRDIYRKLASALHPDRETDTASKASKTDLMKKVNQAYAENDLLTLLELQLKIEQIDASHIAGVSTQQLKHFNKVLSEQLTELKTKSESAQAGFEVEFGMEINCKISPSDLGDIFEHAKRQIRNAVEQQKRDGQILSNAPALKRWIRQQWQIQRQLESDSEFDFVILRASGKQFF